MMNHSWATVELHRWQHGTLPTNSQKEIKMPEALRAGAKLIMSKDCPSAFNVSSVLETVAEWVEDLIGLIEKSKEACKDHPEDVEGILKSWQTSIPGFTPPKTKNESEDIFTSYMKSKGEDNAEN